MFYPTKAKTINKCQTSCGEHSLKYPFGFSSGCGIQLKCIESKQVQIEKLQVQNITSDSIFINLPAKCNRSISYIDPLFGDNFAPTWNNSFLVQRCSSNLGGCVIPTSSFPGSLVLKGCDNNNGKSSDDINCFTRMKGNKDVVMRHEDWRRSGYRFLFSAIAIAVDKTKDPKTSGCSFRWLSWGGGFKGRVIAMTTQLVLPSLLLEENKVSDANAAKASPEMDS
ncbi:hypothetical protein RIF29_34035 [Crotalaria pallida]|uniref:Wall-associated receptor kinase galacturonan-binding domain-containing protein n=1 Tax=Crotalaria pallida TaxID=3830 RepID=A0AAN9EB92_CROPI